MVIWRFEKWLNFGYSVENILKHETLCFLSFVTFLWNEEKEIVMSQPHIARLSIIHEWIGNIVGRLTGLEIIMISTWNIHFTSFSESYICRNYNLANLWHFSCKSVEVTWWNFTKCFLKHLPQIGLAWWALLVYLPQKLNHYDIWWLHLLKHLFTWIFTSFSVQCLSFLPILILYFYGPVSDMAFYLLLFE